MKKNDCRKLIILAALVAAVYLPTFIWMVGRWLAPDTYYSHGFLVPFISLFIIWRKRQELQAFESEPLPRAGWLFFIAGIAIHAISALWQIYFSSAFSLIFVLVGLVILFFGKYFLDAVLFPILFLIFMIPLPLVAMANLSYRLKVFASELATLIVNRVGILATREGSVIKTMHSYLVVDDLCSGIRSMISLIALGALMAHMSRLGRAKKIALFFASIPIAILSNVIRIVIFTIISEVYGPGACSGFFHDIAGILVFVIAFFGLLVTSKILE